MAVDFARIGRFHSIVISILYAHLIISRTDATIQSVSLGKLNDGEEVKDRGPLVASGVPNPGLDDLDIDRQAAVTGEKVSIAHSKSRR
ncbi:hypothetical protein BHE74_00025043 [Ensete ventricosum]|nr:hypothetical protein BHE74_00025025 [Ensete ventricosum]RWW67512.1 hypothetical protein BHE74_00025043 [Ensete ventricosum]